MKKIVALLLTLCMCISFAGCGNEAEVVDECDHVWQDATCEKPEKCSECGETRGSAKGHSYLSIGYCSECGKSDPDYNYTPPSNTQSNNSDSHTHWYTSKTTREATCAKEGVQTFTCSCGKSYTEAIAKKTYHDWVYATCTSPKKCKVCGKTEGSASGHSYNSQHKCYNCGQMDPQASAVISKCSLELPTLPKTIHEYSYSGKLESSVSVTGITPKFEYYGDGKVILTVKFSGKKTYDYRGSGQSDRCSIGWKLYDPQGNVFRAGTFDSPSIAMGETFANQEEDLIYNFEASAPGKYKLVLVNVN